MYGHMNVKKKMELSTTPLQKPQNFSFCNFMHFLYSSY
jgi:hypothetical protein